MKMTIPTVLVVLAILVGTLLPAAAQDSQTQRALQARLDRFARACMHHDMPAIRRMIPQGFVFRANPGETLQREEFLKLIQEREDSVHHLRVKITLNRVTEQADGVSGEATAVTMGDVVDSSGLHSHLSTTEYIVLQWSKPRDGQYELASAERRAITVKRDGKIIRQEKH